MHATPRLAALSDRQLAAIINQLPADAPRGRPWSRPLPQRVVIACAALRTKLTMRELAAIYGISKSAAHRIVHTLTRALAALVHTHAPRDRHESWVVDGTLVPTRDHRYAAKSKNYRWSCNAQILVRRSDLRVVHTAVGGPGNRNDPVHYRGSRLQVLCRQHGRVLVDGGYRGIAELVTPRFRGNRILRDRAWAGTDAVARESSTPSPVSRTGASFETTGVAAAISPVQSPLSPTCTTSDSHYGTALSAASRGR